MTGRPRFVLPATGKALRYALAVAALAPSVAIAAPTADANLLQAIEALDNDELVRARIGFETALQIDNLPRNIGNIDEIYEAEAKARLAGRKISASGYVVASAGTYREKSTIAGAGEASDLFGGLRFGGRLSAAMSDRFTLTANVDYRYRNYDSAGRRDDSDLRWNITGNRVFGDSALSFGVRGWSSYRGDGITRTDIGVFTTMRIKNGPDDQFEIGVDVARRRYPSGPLRERSRDIVEATAGWTHAIGDASFTLAAHGGREFATGDRPDGDSNFFGLSPSVDVVISKKLTGYAFLWWQNDRYNAERHQSDGASDGVAIGARNDDLIEIVGGLAWAFAPGWEAGPGLLYLRDFSNIVSVNYSSVELFLSLRKDF